MKLERIRREMPRNAGYPEAARPADAGFADGRSFLSAGVDG